MGCVDLQPCFSSKNQQDVVVDVFTAAADTYAIRSVLYVPLLTVINVVVEINGAEEGCVLTLKRQVNNAITSGSPNVRRV